MLNPTTKADRIDYGAMLTPPYGYKLNKAIGTTYSLDMETLIGLTVNLGLIHDIDEEVQNDYIGVLAALSRMTNKMLVFCEAGQIKKSKKFRPIFSLLEKVIVPVALERKTNNHYASFHPKFWLLEYVNDNDDKKYRIATLSRNLTFDHSWDIAIAIDGTKKGLFDDNTERIQHFIAFLSQQLSTESQYYGHQLDLLNTFIDDLNDVVFDLDDKQFDYFEFIPLGIGDRSINIKDMLISTNSKNLLVVSPFVSSSVIESLSDSCSEDHILITRKTELDKISKDEGFGFDVYVMKDEIIDGESNLSEDSNNAFEDTENLALSEEYSKQDIHAKIYFVEDDNYTSLYLGSMNATTNAMNNNIETMIKLTTDSFMYSYHEMKNEIMGDASDERHCPFELAEFSEIQEQDADEEVKRQIEQIIKEICRLNKAATVHSKENDLYDVEITFEDYNCDANVLITPYLCQLSSKLASSVLIEDLKLINLSEFYVVSVAKGNQTIERIINIPTEGIPSIREQKIVRSIINSRKEFIQYISFLLDENYLQALFEHKELFNSGFYKNADVLPSIYEKMLRTASSEPEKIQDLQNVVEMLGNDEVIPEEFKEMYKVFSEVLGFDVKD